MDHQRNSSHNDMLWRQSAVAIVLPAGGMPYLCRSIPHAGQFMDHDSNHRRSTSRHRQGGRIQRRADCRRNHLGGIFRRQDLSSVRHHRPGFLDSGDSPLHPYPLHADHHRSILRDSADSIHCDRPLRHSGYACGHGDVHQRNLR